MLMKSKVVDHDRHRLNTLVKPYRKLDNYTNFFYLAADYLTLIAVLGLTITFCHNRAAWQLGWYWNIPVVTLAAISDQAAFSFWHSRTSAALPIADGDYKPDVALALPQT